MNNYDYICKILLINHEKSYYVMNIVDRLKSYMDYIGLASTQFADVANIPRPTISQILNGRNRKISNEVIEKLHQGFPNLNIMWLLFGDGDMEVRSNFKTSEPIVNSGIFGSLPQNSNNAGYSMPASSPKVNTPMQNSNIDDFVNNTIYQRNITEENAGGTINAPTTHTTRAGEKNIRYIMVFFNDNSFEVLKPAL